MSFQIDCGFKGFHSADSYQSMFEEMELKRLRLGRGREVYVYGLWKSYERAGALVVVNQFLSFSVLFPVSLFLGNTFCFVIV